MIRDGVGRLKPLGMDERRVYESVNALAKRSFSRLTYCPDDLVESRRCLLDVWYRTKHKNGWIRYRIQPSE